MYRYVAGRLAWAGFAALAVLSAYFALLSLAPDAEQARFAFRAAARGADVSEAQRTYERLRGLDRPLFERYAEFVGNVARGNFGWSFSRDRPVRAALLEALPYTLQYAAPSALIAVVVGYAVGLYAALHRRTPADHAASALAFFGISVPDFWLGIVSLLLFAVLAPEVAVLGFDVLPLPSYYRTGVVLDSGFLSVANARQLLLPVFVVSTGAVAANARYARAEATEYVRATFVKAARARGADDRRVLFRHVLRPALVPLLTVLLTDLLALLLAGAYLTEVVFQIPGVALLGYEALRAGDTPLVVATTLLPVLAVLLGNLVQDVAYRALDPRIGYGGRE
jgi:peptide/nickel transport system permease protein